MALLGVGVGAGITFVLIPAGVRAFVVAIKLFAAACVWLAASLSAGASVWSLVATLGRAAASAAAAPEASAMLWVLIFVAILALYGLERLLDSEEE